MNTKLGIDIDNLPEEFKKLFKDEIKNMEKEAEMVEKAKKWVGDFGVRHSIKMFANNTDMNKPRLKLDYEIGLGGGSYTDGKQVRLALPENWIHRGEEDWVRFMKFVAAHELGHINWSDFDVFVNFQKRAESYFEKKHNVKGMGRFAGNMLNITEDGRIERGQANLMPGLRKYIKYVNGVNYEEFPSEQLGIVPLHDFTNVSLTLSKVGLLPKGYKERLEGTETDEAITKAMPFIVEAIRAKTAQACAEATWKILMENEDFLAEATKEIQLEQEKLEQMMQGDDLNENQESSEGQEQQSSGNSGEGAQGSSENNEQDSPGDGSRSADGENASPSDSSEDNNNGKKGGETVKINPLDKFDGKADYSNKPSMGEIADGDSSTHFGDEEDLQEGKAKSQSLSGADEDKESDTKGDDASNGEENTDDKSSDDSDMGNTLDELIVMTENDSIDFLNKAKEVAKRENSRIAREKAERQKTDVSNKDINGVLSEYKNNYQFKYVEERFVDNGPISKEVMTAGRGLKRDLKEIFEDKKGWSLNNQRSGMLDENQLYRAGSGLQQNDVFIKRQIPEDSNWVVSLLIDNSGSMGGRVFDDSRRMLGTKAKVAREATAMLEIALNGLVPVKITRFDLSWSDNIQHAHVRGWEQKTRDVLSWNSTDSTGGGNSDAMSIGVAVEELKNRPESKKLLIVLSDGLPSGNTPDQVKKVIEESKKDGVKIVGIGFGPEEELENNEETYRYMYDKDIVLTMPDQLSKELVKILRSTIARG